MRTFSQLGHVYRTQPCIEYPGTWIVYVNGDERTRFDSFDIAYGAARLVAETEDNVSLCWECSDNDPRVGQIWFTPFYQHGRFDQFCRYRNV